MVMVVAMDVLARVATLVCLGWCGWWVVGGDDAPLSVFGWVVGGGGRWSVMQWGGCVFVCVCMCVCVYVCMCKCICMCVMCLYVCVYTYVCVYVYVCVCMYVCMCVYVC